MKRKRTCAFFCCASTLEGNCLFHLRAEQEEHNTKQE
jgi:hypothetical protein